MNKKKDEFNISISLPKASLSDLRGKQSVRATFRLTREAVNTLSIVAAHLEIKQKSLFDHLIEDLKTLESIAREINSDEIEPEYRVSKTYVLSRKTLSSLEKTSKNFDAPRDSLVEYSIKRLMPIILKERELHQNRKKALKELKDYLDEGEKILEKTKLALGGEDPAYLKIKKAVEGVRQSCRFVDSYIEKGKKIEDFYI